MCGDSTSHSGQTACGEHERALPLPALHRVLCRGLLTWPGEGVWEGLPRVARRSGEGRGGEGKENQKRTNERWRENGETSQFFFFFAVCLTKPVMGETLH